MVIEMLAFIKSECLDKVWVLKFLHKDKEDGEEESIPWI